MRHNYRYSCLYILLLVLLAAASLSLGACSRKKAAQVSEGHSDNVKAFLLIFDNRSDQQKLVKDMEEGKIPTRVVSEPIEMTWVEKKSSAKGKKEAEAEEEASGQDAVTGDSAGSQDSTDTDDGLVDRDMVLVEKVIKDRVYVTEDEQQIRQLYKAMTDMIVVGQTEDQNNATKCRITYYLQDGTASVFEFDSVGLITIGGQEYVLESDGSFWKLMPDMF